MIVYEVVDIAADSHIAVVRAILDVAKKTSSPLLTLPESVLSFFSPLKGSVIVVFRSISNE